MEYKGTGPGGFIADIFFSVFYFPQSFFSRIFLFVLVKPILLFVKWRAQTRNYNNGFTVIDLVDCLHWPHKQMWKTLKFAFRLHKAFAGYSPEHWFERLVNWNTSIPLRGYSEGKPSFRINGLFEEVEKDEKGSWKRAEHLDFQTINYVGKFLILSKEMIQHSGSSIPDLSLKCIWVSGQYSGMGFTLERYSNWEYTNSLVPRVIHFPPKILMLIFGDCVFDIPKNL